jgi:PAS domain S-box-containing protein
VEDVSTAALAEAVVREAAEAIVVTGTDGTIRLWNKGAERVFGYPAAEAVGRSLDLIIPERLREAHWTGYRKVMETGETRYGDSMLRVPATHRDGRRRSIEFSVALLRDGAGKLTGISAVIRDVTDRWNAERARTATERDLRARVAELEGKLAAAGTPD